MSRSLDLLPNRCLEGTGHQFASALRESFSYVPVRLNQFGPLPSLGFGAPTFRFLWTFSQIDGFKDVSEELVSICDDSSIDSDTWYCGLIVFFFVVS